MKSLPWTLCLFMVTAAIPAAPRAARLHPEVGSPHYILEQGSERSTEPPAFTLWEVRPSERTQNPLSGSRKIAEGVGHRVSQFGLSGYSILPGQIQIGTVWTLSDQGELKFGLGKSWTTYSTEVAALTSGAEAKLYAITRSGRILQLRGTQVRDIGQVTHLVAGKILESSVHISSWDPALEFLDQAGTLHRYHLGTRTWTRDELSPRTGGGKLFFTSAWKVSPTLVWDISGNKVELLNRKNFEATGLTIQSTLLDDAVTEVLSADAAGLVVRSGSHIWKFTPNTFGPRLSLSLLATDFYSAELRSYGIMTGLFRDVRAVRPSNFDRVSIRRNDFEVGIYHISEPEVDDPIPVSPARVQSRDDNGHRAPMSAAQAFDFLFNKTKPQSVQPVPAASIPLGGSTLGTHQRLGNRPEASDSSRNCSRQLLPPNND